MTELKKTELTKNSKILYSFISKIKSIEKQPINKKNIKIIKNFYSELIECYSYLNDYKQKLGNSFYKLKINEIKYDHQISKPTTFPSNGFPVEIREYIDTFSVKELHYHFTIMNRPIKIIFIVEDENVELLIEQYNTYVDYILLWLLFVNDYASKKCVSELTIYLYFTSLVKSLPTSNVSILNENNVNTAFTMTCPSISEIVIFRKEEWFKVLIHESFHNFGLDFSAANNEECNKIILSLFGVKSDVNLYEAYSEFWARVLNSLFVSFIYQININKSGFNEFVSLFNKIINEEIIYSYFQMVKVLNFMDLSYNTLSGNDELSLNIKKTLYKEDTNVLSYYIITLILLSDYQDTIEWCNKNNANILSFKRTNTNIKKFCELIFKKYNDVQFIKNIKKMENILVKLKDKGKDKRKINNKFILNNLRMTIYDF